jgi:exonuclease SbcD
MKLLHTSDWHVGKSLRGQSRLPEQRAVLAEIVEIAQTEQVDVALIAGDLYETSMPSPDAQQLALKTLLDLKATGAHVVVIAGNHDNPWVFEALRPLAAAAGITMLGQVARPADGGVVKFEARSGEPLHMALLPFCSQRAIVRAADLLRDDAAQHAGQYAQRVAGVLHALMAGFVADETVNIVAAHCMVRGGRLGGGERDAQTTEDYYVNPTVFGGLPHYVALGHLHLTQKLPGGCPIWYSGSPIQVDFGEEGDDKHVLIVEAHPGLPVADPRKVKLVAPRRLETLRGSMAELREVAGTTGDALLRVYVQGKARAGLADEVRELFPNAVDVMIDSPQDEGAKKEGCSARPRNPHELFGAYLSERGIDDERVERLFARLLDEETTASLDNRSS